MINLKTTLKLLKHNLTVNKSYEAAYSWAQQRAYGLIALQPMLGVVNLRKAFGQGLGIIMMIAFIFGLIKVISGAVAISNGNPDGKSAILGGMLVAGAGSVMMALFKIFGMGAGALTPDFGF